MTNVRCKYCGSSKTSKRGKTTKGRQRWYCNKCSKSWSKARKQYKAYSKQQMFNKWMNGSSIAAVAKLTRLSYTHTYRILITQLEQTPTWNKTAITESRYIALDGKYLFGRKRTVLVLFNTLTNLPIACKLVRGESKRDITAFLVELKDLGLSPIAVTTNGRGTISQCFRDIFPDIITQRCLFHIVLQVNAWVKRPPRHPLGWDLKRLVGTLMQVHTKEEVIIFWSTYEQILVDNKDRIDSLRASSGFMRQANDILKCLTLLSNASEDLFNYLDDPNIATTTSGLEGFNKQIQKIKGFDHNGLTEHHIDLFIRHYILTKCTSTK